MLSIPVLLALGALAVLTWLVLSSSPTTTTKSTLPLPPGPPRLPLIGNLHQAPTTSPWLTYTAWSKTYGPIMHLRYGLDTIIMLSNHTTSRDLLDKRSAIYSSRPHLVMGDDVVSKGNRSLLMPYGPRYRKFQRIQGGVVGLRMAGMYTGLQDLESKQLMYELLSVSEDGWMDRFHRYSSSLVFGLAYGKRMPRGDEEEVHAVGQLMESFLYSARVGTWIVDAIPALNKLPTFLAPWKRTGQKFHDFEAAFYGRNLEEARKSRHWNWAKQGESMKEAQEMSELERAYLIGILYEAGSDTTTMALQSFVLAMVAYPKVMKEIQAQLDGVVGDKMPTFEDRPNLSIIDATAKETLRWRPVSAGGIPHAVTQEDEYMGYRIPAGSTVISNHWACDMDDEVYGPDVRSFRPARWIENPDLPLASWGYGRRVCTGQHIAMNSLYINIARVLWAFDVLPALDRHGKKIDVDIMAYSQGFNSGPMPFKARFVARTEQRRAEVERQWTAVEKDIGVQLDRIGAATARVS